MEADREKDIQAQLEADRRRIKEEETKSAATETERIRGEEELCKRIAEEVGGLTWAHLVVSSLKVWSQLNRNVVMFTSAIN